MQRTHRQRHRWLWLLCTALAAFILVFAFTNRPNWEALRPVAPASAP